MKRAGKEWVIKKSLMEILLHIELQHLDLAESRIRTFRRSHKEHLKKRNELRVLTYLKLCEAYFRHPEQVENPKFLEKIESSFDWLPLATEDIFAISFYAWLKSKIQNKPLYTVTLDLIERSQSVNE